MEIDWKALAKYGEATIHCRCGTVYRSLTKGVMDDGKFSIFQQKPCPQCGQFKDNARRVEFDPETWEIG
jgi:hypothetical protein